MSLVRCGPVGIPQTRQDLELFLKAIEPLAIARSEVETERGVLRFEPTGAQAEFHPAIADAVELGDLDGEQSGRSEGGGAHERPEPNPTRFDGDSRKCQECVAAQLVADQQVLRSKPAREARSLGPLRVSDHRRVRIGRRLSKYPDLSHGAIVAERW
jgi:hypothetical protein